jgi:hypothetical protein
MQLFETFKTKGTAPIARMTTARRTDGTIVLIFAGKSDKRYHIEMSTSELAAIGRLKRGEHLSA